MCSDSWPYLATKHVLGFFGDEFGCHGFDERRWFHRSVGYCTESQGIFFERLIHNVMLCMNFFHFFRFIRRRILGTSSASFIPVLSSTLVTSRRRESAGWFSTLAGCTILASNSDKRKLPHIRFPDVVARFRIEHSASKSIWILNWALSRYGLICDTVQTTARQALGKVS